jgi:selenocysteine-specific elongation factor
VVARFRDSVRELLDRYHREHPLRPGMDAADLLRGLPASTPKVRAALEQGLAGELLETLTREGTLARAGTVVRLASHRVTLGGREAEAQRLVDAVETAEPSPPTVRDLEEAGFSGELVEACVGAGRLVRVSDDLVVTPGFAARAESVAREQASTPEGLTVSRFRELLGTSRKYALPILGWLDERRITRRDGDVRRPGSAASPDRP